MRSLFFTRSVQVDRNNVNKQNQNINKQKRLVFAIMSCRQSSAFFRRQHIFLYGSLYVTLIDKTWCSFQLQPITWQISQLSQSKMILLKKNARTNRSNRSDKPKFHYADFPVTSATSPRQARDIPATRHDNVYEWSQWDSVPTRNTSSSRARRHIQDVEVAPTS